MDRSRVEFSVTCTAGMLNVVIGVFSVVLGALNHKIESVAWGCSSMGMGLAFISLSVQRILNIKLDVIHNSLTPQKKTGINGMQLIGYLLTIAGFISLIGGLVVLSLSAFNIVAITNSGFGLGLSSLGFGFINLGKRNLDSVMLDDIINGLNLIGKHIEDIEKTTMNSPKKIELKSKPHLNKRKKSGSKRKH